VSTGTRRQDHDRADAYAYLRSKVNFELGRYARRLKAAAEAHVDEAYQIAAVNGEPFDAVAAADEGLRVAFERYFAQEQIEAPAEEVDAEAPPA
jgi:hypothetical protein